jgi:hypothetical protein
VYLEYSSNASLERARLSFLLLELLVVSFMAAMHAVALLRSSLMASCTTQGWYFTDGSCDMMVYDGS